MKKNLQETRLDSESKRDKKTIYAVLNTALILIISTAIYIFISWLIRAFSGDTTINPIAFQVLNIKVHWYGICFIIGFLLALIYVIFRGRAEKQTLDDTTNLIFIAAIFGMLGARLAFVSLNFSYYFWHPAEILNIWEGGLTLYGAVALGFIAILIYCKKRNLNLWKILDIFAPAMLIGQVFGRWGNFFNQELFGYPTNSFLKMYVTPYNRPWEFRNSAFFHPVFLYESVLSFIAFIALAVIAAKTRLKSGTIFALYLMVYSAIRFVVEFIRIEPKIYLGLTLGQYISAGIFLIAVVIIIFLKKKK